MQLVNQSRGINTSFSNPKNPSGLTEMLKGGISSYYIKSLGKKGSISVNVIDTFFYKYKGRSSYITWTKFFKTQLGKQGSENFSFFCFERGHLIKTKCVYPSMKIYVWPCSFFINKRPEALFTQVLKDVWLYMTSFTLICHIKWIEKHAYFMKS